MARPRKLLVVDADVVIDFCEADILMLGKVSRYVGQVHILTTVLDEVDQLTEAKCTELAIVVLDPPVEIVSTVPGRRSGLSINDQLCLAVAKENGWTCVTNDRALRRACKAVDVESLWGLETLVLVVEAGGVAAEEALAVATSIRRENPRFITDDIMAAFAARVERARKARKKKGPR